MSIEGPEQGRKAVGQMILKEFGTLLPTPKDASVKGETYVQRRQRLTAICKRYVDSGVGGLTGEELPSTLCPRQLAKQLVPPDLPLRRDWW